MPQTCGMRVVETEVSPIVLEVEHKLAKARELMHAHRLDALVLGRADSFAWITGGGNSRCVSSTDAGVASVLITLDRQFILTSSVETERIDEEVLAHLSPFHVFDTVSYPWYEETESAILGIMAEMGVSSDHRYGADLPLQGAKLVHPRLISLRVPFTSWEAQRYPSIGMGVSDAVERVCWEIRPEMTEREIAGEVARELMSAGATPAISWLAPTTESRRDGTRSPPTGCSTDTA